MALSKVLTSPAAALVDRKTPGDFLYTQAEAWKEGSMRFRHAVLAGCPLAALALTACVSASGGSGDDAAPDPVAADVQPKVDVAQEIHAQDTIEALADVDASDV